MPYLYKCTECKRYTLSDKRCPYCNNPVSSPAPPKYSPQDKYGKYRRDAKRKSKSLHN